MTSEYLQDIFHYYTSKITTGLTLPPSQVINREKILTLLYSICESNNLSPSSFQLSVQLFNTFLSNTPINPPNLELVGLTSLFISNKYYGEAHWDLVQMERISSNKFSSFHIQITEIFILQSINWQVANPTASEILRVLLLVTGVNSNFQKVFERSDAFVVTCYLDAKFCRYCAAEIAVVAVVCALEQFNQIAFRNQWVGFVCTRLRLDGSRLDGCKMMLVEKLILLTPAVDRNKIECLTRENVSSLILAKDNLK